MLRNRELSESVDSDLEIIGEQKDFFFCVRKPTCNFSEFHVFLSIDNADQIVAHFILHLVRPLGV